MNPDLRKYTTHPHPSDTVAVESAPVGDRLSPFTGDPMPTQPQYRGPWRRISRTVRNNNPQCAWCSTSNDLVADHLVPGKPEYGVRTLCRSCNTRRRNGATGPRPADT